MIFNMTGGGGNTPIELVWENASPNSSFSAQTISLGLSEDDWIAIIYKTNTSGTVNYTKFVEVGNDAMLHAYTNTTSTSPLGFGSRRANTTTAGVKFEKGGYKAMENSSTYSSDNAYIIPLRIYVIKGVQR